MLATYNIDPIKLFLDNKKNKIKIFITFPNVARLATLVFANVSTHATLGYGFFFFFFSLNIMFHSVILY
jgi:hypothetical protein